ncbi:ABC transporter permease [Wenyingzhuangia marina]|uniref:Lipoprotein-releasing system permease protein n=1 Tax=Wenyingzhuangia marina TaxID=1195760 RepID=A0A1M5VHN9_9FLAO|nr:FtsX-like permease family protein [Wenyingzhuangia marina]SHH74779.1 lipoprotein-releasing system permease protein [Wenyingzhuangia marina]
MNFELFIANRLTRSQEYKNSVSSPIIKIAIIAIALGMMMMIISIATGIGLQRKIRDKVAGFNGHVVISNYDNNQSKTTQNPISIHQNFYPKFTTVSGIKHVQVFATRAGIIRTEDSFEGVVLKGVDKDYDWSFFKEYLQAGRLPVFSDKASKEVLVSKIIADRMQFKLEDTFDTYFIKEDPNTMPNRRVFKIVGIYDTGFEEFDKNIMIGDINQIRGLNKWKNDQVGGFEVFVNDFNEIDSKSKEIYQEIDVTLDSQSLFEQYPQIFEWLQLFDGNIAVIIIIMIVVAGINMITALLVLILERTQVIGVLKTLGAKSWSIRKIFLYNASYIIGRGLLIGNITGLLVIYLQYQFKFIELDPQNYYVHVAPVYITFTQIVILNLGTLILCVLMMLIPSYIITRISPAKSVKFS